MRRLTDTLAFVSLLFATLTCTYCLLLVIRYLHHLAS